MYLLLEYVLFIINPVKLDVIELSFRCSVYPKCQRQNRALSSPIAKWI